MNEPKLPFRTVLLADVADSREEITIARNDLERVPADYLEQVRAGLSEICTGVIVYSSPRELIENIRDHADDIVLSIWSGVDSRNRKALVPSICEAYGITYVGADTYTHVLCQDKSLCKRFTEKYGFQTPASQLITRREELDRVALLKPPLVVKPNFEGGSIGISRNNLVASYGEAESLCVQLLEIYRQPVLVEEFVEGRELSVVLAGHHDSISVFQAVELVLTKDPTALHRGLWSYELKKAVAGRGQVEKRIVTTELDAELVEMAQALFKALDKVEILRIDGRLHAEGFSLIELSPDAHLGPKASVGVAFTAAGFTYPAMLRMLLENALASRLPQFPSASS